MAHKKILKKWQALRNKREVKVHDDQKTRTHVSRFVCINATLIEQAESSAKLLDIINEMDLLQKNQSQDLSNTIIPFSDSGTFFIFQKLIHSNKKIYLYILAVEMPQSQDPRIKCILYKFNGKVMEDRVKMLYEEAHNNTDLVEKTGKISYTFVLKYLN